MQGVSEPGLAASAMGGAAGVHERPGQALTEALAEQLHARHLLVVLDNCEHLVEACAVLVGELSSACPQLHVLATSRVPLVVDGEATFELAGLPVPDPDGGSASTVAAADAARLFEVRARQVSTDFRIGPENASAVAEICRRLDGIPLAIELAAARVRVLAPGQIAAGLSDWFGLLTGGVRGAPARQLTLLVCASPSGPIGHDGHEVTVAAPPNVINLERCYLQLTDSTMRSQLALVDVRSGTARIIDGTAIEGAHHLHRLVSLGRSRLHGRWQPVGERTVIEYRLGAERARRLPVEVGDFYGMAAA